MRSVAIITGASRGIGYSTAAHFLTHGWHVINLARTPCNLENVYSYPLDLSEPNWPLQHRHAIQQAIHSAAKICLVHNAANHVNDTLNTVEAATFNHAVAINLLAPILLNQICLPYMLPGSSIIYLGSTLSEKAVAGAFSYVTMKHAIVGMMRATCQDLIDRVLHTVCICPGFTNTEMLQQHLNHDPERIKAIAHMTGAKRLIEPEEIAEVIFLSANNPVFNGAVLHTNLGQIER